MLVGSYDCYVLGTIPESPRCFGDGVNWRRWLALARFTRKRDDDYCIDCTIEYARQMRGVGRCEGTPGRHTSKRKCGVIQ